MTGTSGPVFVSQRRCINIIVAVSSKAASGSCINRVGYGMQQRSRIWYMLVERRVHNALDGVLSIIAQVRGHLGQPFNRVILGSCWVRGSSNNALTVGVQVRGHLVLPNCILIIGNRLVHWTSNDALITGHQVRGHLV